MDALDILILIAALSVMFATVSLWVFTDFVMRGLARKSFLAAAQAMQGINETVLRSGFIMLFMLNNVLLFVIMVMAFVQSSNTSLAVVAFCLYFFGVFLVTGTRNVPLNERLGKAKFATEAEARTAWGWYAKPWQMWNTVRCICGFMVVATLFVMLYL